VLWNGNVEPPLRTFLTERDHIVRWAWRTHARTGSRVMRARAGRPELVVVRLTTRAQVSAWLDGPLRAATYRCPLPPGAWPGIVDARSSTKGILTAYCW
jgi:hypothetical protein